MKAKGGEVPGMVPAPRVRFRRYRDLDHAIATCPWFTERARKVLLAIMGYVDAEGVCWPSLATLAKETRYHVRSVKRGVSELRGAGMMVREARGVFRVDLVRVASLAGDRVVPSGDRTVPVEGTELSPGRGQPCHTELCSMNDQPQNTPGGSGELVAEAEPGAVCVLSEGSSEEKIRWVAEAFPLPHDKGGAQVIGKALRGCIAEACDAYGPRVVRRAVELMGSASWRSAPLGAWVFSCDSFPELVAQAQREQTARARRAAAPRVSERQPVVVASTRGIDFSSWREAIAGGK